MSWRTLAINMAETDGAKDPFLVGVFLLILVLLVPPFSLFLGVFYRFLFLQLLPRWRETANNFKFNYIRIQIDIYQMDIFNDIEYEFQLLLLIVYKIVNALVNQINLEKVFF